MTTRSRRAIRDIGRPTDIDFSFKKEFRIWKFEIGYFLQDGIYSSEYLWTGVEVPSMRHSLHSLDTISGTGTVGPTCFLHFQVEEFLRG